MPSHHRIRTLVQKPLRDALEHLIVALLKRLEGQFGIQEEVVDGLVHGIIHEWVGRSTEEEIRRRAKLSQGSWHPDGRILSIHAQADDRRARPWPP